MKQDQERVKTLLTDTVSLLCKNGLQYNKEMKVQGLLGITLDNDDVFVVHINEIFNGLLGGQLVGVNSGENNTSAIAAADSATQPSHVKHLKSFPRSHRSGLSHKRRGPYRNSAPPVKIKKEAVDDDDLLILDSKSLQDGGSEFIPSGAGTDVSGDGDREAMRLSYGGAMENDAAVASNRPGNSSGSPDSKADVPSRGPFITGLLQNVKDNSEDSGGGDLVNAADDSHLGNLGHLTQDGQVQVVYEDTPGCSAWDSSQGASVGDTDSQAEGKGTGSHDSMQEDDPSQGDHDYTVQLEVADEEEGGHSTVLIMSCEEYTDELLNGADLSVKYGRDLNEGGKVVLAMDSQGGVQLDSEETPLSGSKLNSVVTIEDIVDDAMVALEQSDPPAEEVTLTSRKKARSRNDLNKPFVCTYGNCGHSYHNYKDLKRHKNVKHLRPQEEDLYGAGADGDWSPKKNITRKPKKNGIEKPFPCKYRDCECSYQNSNALAAHERQKHLKPGIGFTPKVLRTDEKRFRCSIVGCVKAFYHRKDLKRHMMNFHKLQVINAPRGRDRARKGRIMCGYPGCGLHFFYKRDAQAHYKHYHPSDDQFSITTVIGPKPVADPSPQKTIYVTPKQATSVKANRSPLVLRSGVKRADKGST